MLGVWESPEGKKNIKKWQTYGKNLEKQWETGTRGVQTGMLGDRIQDMKGFRCHDIPGSMGSRWKFWNCEMIWCLWFSEVSLAAAWQCRGKNWRHDSVVQVRNEGCLNSCTEDEEKQAFANSREKSNWLSWLIGLDRWQEKRQGLHLAFSLV